MFFLPASLLAFLAVSVFAGPIDLPSRRQHASQDCDAATVTQIFDSLSYDAFSATAFCTQVLSANVDLNLIAGRVHGSSASDITAACQCIVSTSKSFASPAPPATTAPSTASEAQQPQRALEMEETRLRAAVPASAGRSWDPYGKGAEPVPLGSEFKGFGGKVPYVRAGIVEGTRW